MSKLREIVKDMVTHNIARKYVNSTEKAFTTEEEIDFWESKLLSLFDQTLREVVGEDRSNEKFNDERDAWFHIGEEHMRQEILARWEKKK